VDVIRLIRVIRSRKSWVTETGLGWIRVRRNGCGSEFGGGCLVSFCMS
jgi:hypothetical protein